IKQSHGIDAEWRAVDLSNGDAARALIAEFADIDILVNNAGAIPAGTLDEIQEPRWREAWDLKVFGYVNMTRAAYANMHSRGGGVIVNVIGAAGENPNAGYVAGSAGNASLMAFTKAVGKVSLADNIRVVACNPGLTLTDRMETMLRGQANEKFGNAERWEECIPTDPAPAKAEDVGDLVTFLASPRACMITGTVITLDGGGYTR
ncbi:MAG: SDR family oxidoreductase, partial [Alphaproteobacteria bacterium]|nr:SDR family oxidoreductase [Alphaproteobacteria bacterium]